MKDGTWIAFHDKESSSREKRPMRVTEESLLRSMMADLNRLQYQQYRTEYEISSGQRVHVPSDDAAISVTILRSRQALQEVDQYKVNLEAAANWMLASESAMQSIVDRLNRASVLAEQVATGTYQKLEQESVAQELETMIDQLISLANTSINNNYIFGGTQTQIPPISALLMAYNPAELTGDTLAGHDVTASYVEVAPGDFRLVFTRDSTDPLDTIVVNGALTTLGESVLGLSFDNWTLTSPADPGPPPTGNQYTVNAAGSVTAATDDVSNRVGEVLSFTADAAAGVQTFINTAVVSFNGTSGPTAASIDIDHEPPAGAPFPLTYAANGSTDEEMAASLAEAINSDVTAGSDYYAWVENGTEVHIMATGGAVLNVTPNVAPPEMNLTQSTTLEGLSNVLNTGVRASGMVHLDDATLPLDTETITLGSQVVTWGEIIAADPAARPTTAAGYASALTYWVNNLTTDFVADSSASGTGATVNIQALTVGSAGNVALASSDPNVITSPGLMGGLDGSGAATQGAIYGLGTSTLRLSTTVHATVMEVDGDDVTLRLRWYDDDGELQNQEVTINGRGDSNAVVVPGLGGLELYLGEQELYSGATFDLQLGHYQGNQEDLYVNFSSGTRMDYNWTALQILGDQLTVSLLGSTAEANPANTGTGTIHLQGAYRGLQARQITFDVIDPGTVPGDDVTLRVTWLGDDGEEHVEQLTMTTNGPGGAVEIPGCDGVSIYLDGNNFDQGDSYQANIEKTPPHLLDTLQEWRYQLLNGTEEEGQEASQKALEAIGLALASVLDHIGTAGTRQDRVSVRQTVMEEQILYNSENLQNLQEVDLTEAFMRLQEQQTAYNATLKVSSIVADLTLINEIG